MEEENNLDLWRKTFKESIEMLKFKEEDCKRKSDDYLLQSNTYMKMRLDIEHLYYKNGIKD